MCSEWVSITTGSKNLLCTKINFLKPKFFTLYNFCMCYVQWYCFHINTMAFGGVKYGVSNFYIDGHIFSKDLIHVSPKCIYGVQCCCLSTKHGEGISSLRVHFVSRVCLHWILTCFLGCKIKKWFFILGLIFWDCFSIAVYEWLSIG